jgi:hypothetical protein
VSEFIAILLSKCEDIQIVCRDMEDNKKNENYAENLNYLKESIKDFGILLCELNKITHEKNIAHISYPLVNIINIDFGRIHNKLFNLYKRQEIYHVLDTVISWEYDTTAALNYLKLIIDNYSVANDNNWINIHSGGNIDIYNTNRLIDIIENMRKRFNLIENICLDAVILNRVIDNKTINESIDEILELINILNEEACSKNLYILRNISDIIYEKIDEIYKNIYDDEMLNWIKENIRYQSMLLDALFIDLIYSLKLYTSDAVFCSYPLFSEEHPILSKIGITLTRTIRNRRNFHRGIQCRI